MRQKYEYKIGEHIKNGITFVSEIETYKGAHRYGIFKCICGNNFECALGSIKSGATKSCGCYRKVKTIT